MITLSFRFPGGRYHATPWGSHVNEGQVEWPPSPWRIARALVAAFHKLADPPDEALTRRVVLALATTAPRYHLPPASSAHTRHYMPVAKTTTKVLDTFVSVSTWDAQDGGGALVVGWDIDLSEPERAALSALLDGLGYLGRAESWIEGSIVDTPVVWNVLPDGPVSDTEVFLWTVLPDAEWAAWRAGFLVGVTTKKKPTLPATSWDILTQDTAGLQKAGWSMPPGVRPVRYPLPSGMIRVVPTGAPRVAPSVDVAWIRLGGAVLPPVGYTTWIAERVRVAAMACSKDGAGLPSPVFSGHLANGQPATGQQHAWFLPSDEDNDGRLDHVAVWAPAGLGDREQEALRRMTSLWGDEGHTLEAILLAFTAGLPRWQEPARVWRSATPYLCARHPKRRGDGWKDGVEEQVAREWAQHWDHRRDWPNPPADAGEPAPTVTVERVQREGPEARTWSTYRLDRPHRGSLGALSHRFDLRLRFDRPVVGPLSLGAGAHFGLGRFTPE